MRSAVFALFFLWVGASFAAEAKLDPAADAAVKRMSDLLAGTKALSFRAASTVTIVKRDGAKKEVKIVNDVVVRRPDAARFHLVGEGRDAIVWYDAGKLALQGNQQKVYARAEIPATLDEAMDFIASRLAIPMPVADVIYSSPHDAFISPETTGRVVGTETIDGASCRHLAFTAPVVDWEIWIREGETPLPCRLHIVYKLADGAPEATVSFSEWNLAPKLAADAFAFAPPDGFRKIRIVARAADAAPLAAKP